MAQEVAADRLKYESLPTDIDGVDAPIQLALDLRSPWHHSADTVWWQLNPTLWEATQNPWAVLQTISRSRLGRVLPDATFRAKLDEQVKGRRLGTGVHLLLRDLSTIAADQRHLFQYGRTCERLGRVRAYVRLEVATVQPSGAELDAFQSGVR